MNIIKKHSILFILLCVNALCNAENIEDKYRRNSVYNILVSHTEQEDYCDFIRGQYLNVPTSDKFNDHNLSVRVIEVNGKKEVTEQSVKDFVDKNNIGAHMVAKWFNRNHETGQCDMTLIKNRGLYNASEFDKEVAAHTMRGEALLQDAGEYLISNSYLIINEIRYIDKNKTARKLGAIFTIAVVVAAATAGVRLDDKFADNLMSLFNALKGFNVKIVSHLFQLDWNERTASIFYTECYTDVPNPLMKSAFEQHRNDFKMKYLGSVESSGSTTSYAGIKEKQPWMMVRKALERALDENVVNLQKAIPAFRIKTPISEIGAFVKAPIGKKEGVEAGKKYEVLEVTEDKGRVKYNRVGVVKPNPVLIWDNRFMAKEENAPGSNLGTTSFIVVSGRNFIPGMLLREME